MSRIPPRLLSTICAALLPGCASSPGTLEAEAIILRDESGASRVELRPGVIVLRDHQGTTRVVLQEVNRGAELWLYGESRNGIRSVVANVKTVADRAELRIEAGGHEAAIQIGLPLDRADFILLSRDQQGRLGGNVTTLSSPQAAPHVLTVHRAGETEVRLP